MNQNAKEKYTTEQRLCFQMSRQARRIKNAGNQVYRYNPWLSGRKNESSALIRG
jgi:hypothetical protein